MRLRRLDLVRYGKFTDHVIDFGERAEGPDLHIVYGLNEAGKSTALSGYLDLLFGIEERSRYGFLHPYGAMEVGAVLEVAGGRHEVRRVKQRSGSLRDAAGQPVSEAVLGGALSGLTREAYRMMFSLDDQTLEDGGNAILDSKGDLGELLFSASAGLSGLSRVLAGVAAEADGIFRKRASTTEIAGLKRRLAELKAERERIDVQASAHAALVGDLARAQAAYDEAVRERGALKARHDDLDRLTRAAPLAAEHARLDEALSALAHLPHPPGHWAADLPALMVDDATWRTRLQGEDERIARLRAEIDGIAVDRAVLGLSERIEALMAAAPRFHTAQDDLPKRRAALDEVRARLANLARAATGGADGLAPDALVIDVPTLGTLRDLIAEWSGIATRLAAASEETGAAAQALDQALADRALLDRTDPPLGPARRAALQAGVGRLREGDLLARHRVAAAAAAAAARDRDEALRALVPWTGSAEALEGMTLPSARQIKAWRDALAGQDLRRDGHRVKLSDLASRRAESEAGIGAAEAVAGAIGDEEAAALRAARDRAWAAHRDRPGPDTAAAFERLMRESDAMAEARLAHADRLADLRGLRRDLALATAQSTRETEGLAETDREQAALASRIAEAAPAGLAAAVAGPAGERLDALDAWIAHWDRAVAALRAHRAAAAEAAGLEAEIAAEARRLAEAVAPADPALARLDAAALLQAAHTLLASDAAQAERRASADERVRDGTRLLAQRREDVESAQAARAVWEERWARALAGTWLADRAADRGAVRAVVDLVAGLPAQIAERDGLSYRVAAMERDCAAFLADLHALHAVLGEAPDAHPASAAAALRERHGAATRALALRREKEADLAALEEARRGLLAAIAVHEARRSEILTFFRAEDLAAVSAHLAACARRDRLEEERAQCAARILRETGCPSLDAALARLAETDPDERAAQRDAHLLRLDDLDARLRSLFAARAGAADRLSAIGGDDAVARIEADRRTVMLEIEDKALRFLHLRTGSLLAERALQIYRDTHRGAMMRRASEAFRAITRDAYAGLATRPDKDRETLIGLTRAGGSKLATDMSKGTRFQLYLALRLAGYAEFAAGRPAVPFVADDIMETFDEPRSAEVLSLFGTMSGLGQVIYLTHHRHLCDLARTVVPGVTVHELPS
ncbi:AAA family ATPase [Methylobacterium sp. JK268]